MFGRKTLQALNEIQASNSILLMTVKSNHDMLISLNDRLRDNEKQLDEIGKQLAEISETVRTCQASDTGLFMRLSELDKKLDTLLASPVSSPVTNNSDDDQYKQERKLAIEMMKR